MRLIDKTAKTKSQRTLKLIKVPVQAYLDPEQADALKALSVRTRIPQQAYIREGVEHVLAKYAKRKSWVP